MECRSFVFWTGGEDKVNLNEVMKLAAILARGLLLSCPAFAT